MATLTKIQVALNHEDPAILIKGLDFFKDSILKEHGAIRSFGYKGRGCSPTVSAVLYPDHPTEIAGLLQQFRHASPQVEELFVVWHLPGRDDNRALCTSHMDCLAAILHCSHADTEFCKTVVHRVLRECSKSLHMQLTSGNIPLVHSTIGLVIELCRTSDQNCRDTYQKLMLNNPSLASLVQKSKAVTFRPGADAEDSDKLSTDTRFMVLLLILTLLRGADMPMASEIFAANSIFRKAYHNMFRDNVATVELIIEGLSVVLKDIGGNSGKFKYSLIDSSFLKSTLKLYDSDEERIRDCAHKYMLGFCSSMTYNSVTAAVVSCLVSSLHGHADLRHRELIQATLKCQPHLLPKFVDSIPSLSDPRPNFKFLAAVSHLVSIIGSTDIDPSLKVLTKDVVKGNRNESAVRNFSRSLFSTLLPHGFGKKEFSKLLMHGNAMVQRMGLLLAITVLQRIIKIIGIENRARSLDVYLAIDIANYLPDMELLVNVRARYIKQQHKSHDPKIDYLILLTLESIRELVSVMPGLVSGGSGNFDVLKLLDDCVAPSASGTVDSSVSNWAHLSTVLEILSSPGVVQHCRWFGSREDVVKIVGQLLTAPDWVSSTQSKRGPLFRLLWLVSHAAGRSDDNEMGVCEGNEAEKFSSKSKGKLCSGAYRKATELLKIVLKSSNMFVGYGHVDTELRLELATLINLLQKADGAVTEREKKAVLLEICIKSAFQFNAEISLWGSGKNSQEHKQQGISKQLFHGKYRDSCYAEYLPISPVLVAMQLFSCSNLNLFIEHLPTPIRRQLQSDGDSCSQFLSKYNEGFGASLQVLVFDVYFNLLVSSWAPVLYSASFISVLTGCSDETGRSDGASLLSNVTRVHELMGAGRSFDSEAEPIETPLFKRIIAQVSDFKIINDEFDFCANLFLASLRIGRMKTLDTSALRDLNAYLDCSISALCNLNMGSTSLESKLIDCVTCCRLISAIHCVLSAQTTSKKRSADISDLETTVEKIVVYVVELIRLTLCASQISECILFCGIADIALSDNTTDSAEVTFLASACMQIVCAAACAHSRRMHSATGRSSKREFESKVTDNQGYDVRNLWDFLCERVLLMLEKKDHKCVDIFHLGWLLQGFSPDNTRLSKIFVNRAFESGSSFALLAPSESSATVVPFNSSRDIVKSQKIPSSDLDLTLNFPSSVISLVSSLDKTVESVMFSGSAKCLMDNLTSSILSGERSMAHVIEGKIYRVGSFKGAGSIQSLPLSNMFGCLSYYSEPLSLINMCSIGVEKLLSQVHDDKNSLINSNTLRRLKSAVSVGNGSIDHVETGVTNVRTAIEEFIGENLPDSQKLFSSFPIRSVMLVIPDECIADNATSVLNMLHPMPSFAGTPLQEQSSCGFGAILSFVRDALHTTWPYLERSDANLFSGKWVDAVGNLIFYFSKCSRHCLRVISDVKADKSTWAAEFDLYYEFLDTLLVVLETISLYSTTLENEEDSRSSVTWDRVKSELNSLIKACLKYSIRDPTNVIFLGNLLKVLHSGSVLTTETESVAEPTTFWRPRVFLELLCSHSMFEECLLTEAHGGEKKSCNLLQLLLQELLLCMHDGIDCDDSDVVDILQGLLLSVMSVYSGTMSTSDRVIYRIAFTVDVMLRKEQSVSTAVLPFNFSKIMSEFTTSNALKCSALKKRKSSKKNGLGVRTCTEYIDNHLSQPGVYATLSHFSFGRRLIMADIFETEDETDADSRNFKAYEDLDNELNESWRKNAKNDTTEVELSGERFDILVSERISQVTDIAEGGAQYDPAFWLIIIRQSLREPGARSVRQLANCGALSMVIAALGSHCDVMRIVALSCLHDIHKLTLAQTPDKDVTFRERPQLLLLFDFIRNSFNQDTAASGISYLPGLSAIFCARAALHLLQSGHELYGVINKYLLSRPFCDVKDVPLFDLLVTTSDSTVSSSERLAAIRLLRDGLNSKEDHLTLCRKNAYSKLMLMFPLFCNEVRTGHAVFDLFDKALCMHSSARYLLERCDLMAWLRSICTLRFGVDSNLPSAAYESQGKSGGVSAVGCPHKLLTRCLLLLRRSIGAMDALRGVWSRNELFSQVDIVRSMFVAIATEICEYDGPLALDFLVQFVCALWDFCIFWSSSVECASADQSPLVWLGTDCFHKLVVILGRQNQTSSPSGRDENKSRKIQHSHGEDTAADLVLSLSLLVSVHSISAAESVSSPSPSLAPMCIGKDNVIILCDLINGIIGASTNYLRLTTSTGSESVTSSRCLVPHELHRILRSESIAEYSKPTSPATVIDGQVRAVIAETQKTIQSTSGWRYVLSTDINFKYLPVSLLSSDFMVASCANGVLSMVQSVLCTVDILKNDEAASIVHNSFSSVLRWGLLLNSIIIIGAAPSSFSSLQTNFRILRACVPCAMFLLVRGVMFHQDTVPESVSYVAWGALLSVWTFLTGETISYSAPALPLNATKRTRSGSDDRTAGGKRDSAVLLSGFSSVIAFVGANSMTADSHYTASESTHEVKCLISHSFDLLSGICSLFDRIENGVAVEESLVGTVLTRLNDYAALFGQYSALVGNVRGLTAKQSDADDGVETSQLGLHFTEKDKIYAYSQIFPGFSKSRFTDSSIVVNDMDVEGEDVENSEVLNDGSDDDSAASDGVHSDRTDSSGENSEDDDDESEAEIEEDIGRNVGQKFARVEGAVDVTHDVATKRTREM